MYTISKEFHFCASHHLPQLEAGHPCTQLHGHNYIVIVELQKEELNKEGFVIDYRKLDPIKEYINDRLDHSHLNDVFVYPPTAENMAQDLFTIFKYRLLFPVKSVTVKETPKTAATYYE